MAEEANGLSAIEVDADDYAEAAAGDAPAVPRTFQSEADFQAQRSSYSAKVDCGNNYEGLFVAVPVLTPHAGRDGDGSATVNGSTKVKLSKKDVQLLSYAVGEMYYARQYKQIIELCGRVREGCECDGKLAESVERWSRRCEERMQGVSTAS